MSPYSPHHCDRPTVATAGPPRPRVRRHARAFSLIELVMVVVLIGIIAAIAATRMIRIATSSAEASMSRNLDLMQRAIDLYAQEHAGTYPHPELIEQQLTQYTDVAGAVSPAKETPYVLGPYLSRIPRVPAGPQKGSSRIAEAPQTGVGWLYQAEKGEIAANTVIAADAPPINTTVASTTTDSGSTQSDSGSTESSTSLTDTITDTTRSLLGR